MSYNAKVYKPNGDVLVIDEGGSIRFECGTTDVTITVTDSEVIVAGLPTSSAGLATGSLWADSGTLKIVTA